MKNTVIFDLDGTLLNTLDDLADSVNYALGECGMPPRTVEEVKGFVGNGIVKLIERAVPPNTKKEDFDKCYALFCDYYKEHMEDKTRPYEGVNGLLKKLKAKGFKTAVVTNKAEFAAVDLCKRMFGAGLDLTVGSCTDRPNKPAPDGVFYALSALGSKKEEAVFVGDSDVDILTAKNAQLDCIGVLWGFRSREVVEKAGADLIAETVDELEKLLLK